MPELPEVETTVCGIRPFLEGEVIQSLTVRNRYLRWPIPEGLEMIVSGCRVTRVTRRAKYIVIAFENDGGLLIHLGMSGSVRVLEDGHDRTVGKHDHFDLTLTNGTRIRYHDPRRFGCLLYAKSNLLGHSRLSALGVEPLTPSFCADYLYGIAKQRRSPIKSLIMNGQIVVGVGNIYACESLFLAGIHPLRRSDRISLRRIGGLVTSIKEVLIQAIEKGGTTLQDFVGADGSPGYFEQRLSVYGREGQSCPRCQSPIHRIVSGQRSTYYCGLCQR